MKNELNKHHKKLLECITKFAESKVKVNDIFRQLADKKAKQSNEKAVLL